MKHQSSNMIYIYILYYIYTLYYIYYIYYILYIMIYIYIYQEYIHNFKYHFKWYPKPPFFLKFRYLLQGMERPRWLGLVAGWMDDLCWHHAGLRRWRWIFFRVFLRVFVGYGPAMDGVFVGVNREKVLAVGEDGFWLRFFGLVCYSQLDLWNIVWD